MARYDDGPGLFGYLIRLILVIAVLAALGLFAFAYFGDLSLPASPQVVPVPVPTAGG